jgi:hypothetical protein
MSAKGASFGLSERRENLRLRSAALRGRTFFVRQEPVYGFVKIEVRLVAKADCVNRPAPLCHDPPDQKCLQCPQGANRKPTATIAPIDPQRRASDLVNPLHDAAIVSGMGSAMQRKSRLFGNARKCGQQDAIRREVIDRKTIRVKRGEKGPEHPIVEALPSDDVMALPALPKARAVRSIDRRKRLNHDRCSRIGSKP